MYMVLNRDYTLRSTTGYTIGFKKDEPTWVPKPVRREAMHIGAMPQDGKPVKPEELPEEPEAQLSETERLEKAPAPEGDDREEIIKEAILAMVARNDSNSFTAAGAPEIRALSRDVNFRVYPSERDKIWNDLQENGVSLG